MAKVVVLGIGRVGLAIAWDLQQVGHEVVMVDRDVNTLKQATARLSAASAVCDVAVDLDGLRKAIAPAELVICAVPGHVGFATVREIIAAGKHCVDISFAPENILELDHFARARDVTVIADMGVAPGMSNWLLGYHNARMRVARFQCYVGGLPKVRTLPFQYKAPFSPRDVIEEYCRPARFREHGATLIKPALSDLELIEIPGVGTLEAFNTDGLRSLLTSFPDVPDLKEKTLRYPGHAALIVALQKAGFFATQPLTVAEYNIVPIEFTSKVLFNDWHLAATDPEFTVMRISIEGEEADSQVIYEYLLYDERDPLTQFSSMARTTGFACTAACDVLITGKWRRAGVFPPEKLAEEQRCHDHVIQYLAARNIKFSVDRIPMKKAAD